MYCLFFMETKIAHRVKLHHQGLLMQFMRSNTFYKTKNTLTGNGGF